VTGDTNFVPVFTSPTTLGDSVIQQAQPAGWSNTAVGFNGVPGSSPSNTSPVGVDIQGTVSEGTPNGFTATQFFVEGTLKSSGFAQAYLRGAIIDPNFDFSGGYGNYAEGLFISAPNLTAGYANVVSTLELGQPGPGAGGTSCSAALNIGLPNQSGNCPVAQNRVWSIYNGSQYNSYFAGNVGFGVPLPTHPIDGPNGSYLSTGGAWTNGSSRTVKKDIRPLPADAAMQTLAALEPGDLQVQDRRRGACRLHRRGRARPGGDQGSQEPERHGHRRRARQGRPAAAARARGAAPGARCAQGASAARKLAKRPHKTDVMD